MDYFSSNDLFQGIVGMTMLRKKTYLLKWKDKDLNVGMFNLFLLLPRVQNMFRTLLQWNGQQHFGYTKTCHLCCKNKKQLICVRGMLSRAFWLLAFY